MPESNKDQEMNRLQWELFFKKSETEGVTEEMAKKIMNLPQDNGPYSMPVPVQEAYCKSLAPKCDPNRKAYIDSFLPEGQNQAAYHYDSIHQQFIQPLQKQVKELTYKVDAYDNVLSIFKIPEGQVIGYIKNFQDRLSSLQAENERLKKELESVKVAAKKVIDVYNGKNT